MSSMKGSMYMMMAMAAIMGGVSMPSHTEPKRKEEPYVPPRKLSPEEWEAELKSRRDKLFSDLVKHNANKGREFKNWKVYDIGNGIEIVSSNIKNAKKIFNKLLKENYLTEETLFGKI